MFTQSFEIFLSPVGPENSQRDLLCACMHIYICSEIRFAFARNLSRGGLTEPAQTFRTLYRRRPPKGTPFQRWQLYPWPTLSTDLTWAFLHCSTTPPCCAVPPWAPDLSPVGRQAAGSAAMPGAPTVLPPFD